MKRVPVRALACVFTTAIAPALAGCGGGGGGDGEAQSTAGADLVTTTIDGSELSMSSARRMTAPRRPPAYSVR